MKRLFIWAAMSALALAKPELYKEQEDFQYSRSSSDDGSKSGFYGAQRGNMGGNYEHAHNMDSLAQNQMSGLVRQVEGELGDGANMRAGQVYTSANSKGIYGSGHFDLSNLAGRNFNEGTYYGNSQSHSSQSQTSSAQSNANYASSNSHSHSNSRYRGYQTADAQTQTDDLQALDNSQASNQYYNYGRHSSGFQSQAGFQEHGEYANSKANSNSGHGSSNIRTRIISATPVRVVLTPGGRVAIPVAAQTYDATQGSSALEQNAQNSNSMSISDDNQGYIPSNAKHYESSYRYHKKWEKHDTIPTGFSIVPVTDAPIPLNSELLEDRGAHLQENYDTRGLNSHSQHSSSASGSYSGVKSSSQSRYQSKYNSQYHGDSSTSNANLNNQFRYAGANHGESLQSGLNANSHSDYTGSNSDLNSQVENLNTKPKSYHSSYSYHKSWERQGDPYVIKPASSGYYDSQASQRLTNQGYAAHQSGSHYGQNQADCDESGQIRIARSSNTDNKDMQQQNQNLEDLDELTQQVQSARQYTGDLSQQSQTQWGQQDLGQQSQNKWENLDDLNQQAQNNWGQQSNLEQSNVDQQFQNQNQWDNLELGQQSQTNLEQQNVGQESQHQWDTFENLGYQSNKNWGAFQPNTFDDITQQQQTSDTNPESFRKQLQNYGGEHSQDIEQQQTHQPHNNNTRTSLDASQKELEDKVPHKFESPWDKFDINDAHKINKPTTEQNIDDFYWHHIPMEDQRINKLNANGDIISGFGHQYINTGPIVEQANEYPGFDNSYNPNIPYSYSNGFVNPTINNKRNFYPENQNHQQVNSGNIHSWPTQTHKNYHSQDSWQTHATESNSFSQESKILSLWDKFDTIEKESHFSTDDLKHVPKQAENSFSLSNTQRSVETTYASTYVSQTDGKLDISSDNQVTPKQEAQTVSPKKYSVSGTELPEEIENSNGKEPETTQDIGRGDIGADDSFSSPIIPKPHNPENNSDDKKLNVLGLKPEEETKQTDDINHDFREVSQQSNNNSQTSNTKLNDTETSEQYTENLQNEKLDFQQESIDLTAQNVNKEHKFDFQNTQNIHHQTNFEQQASNKVEQEKRQDFAEQNHDLEQQNIHYFDQQNVQDFGQQSENLEQNVQDFGQQSENFQQNVQDFGQESENVQQNIQDFGQQSENVQQNVQDFAQQSENIQQNIQDFGEQSENVQAFGQQSENLEQNVQDFGPQSENFQQNVQDFGQQSKNIEQNVQEFGLQSENVQKNLQDFGQQSENSEQNIQDFGQQSEYLEHNVQDFGKHENIPQNVLDFRHESNIRELRHDTDTVDRQMMQNIDKPIFEPQLEQNINQENVNQQTLQQENAHHIWAENEQQRQQHLQDFGQISIQDFRLPKPNDGQQHYKNINIPSEDLSYSDKLHQLENPKKEVQPEIIQERTAEQVTDKNVEQKQISNLEQPNVAEKENSQTVVEKTAEKPGFWKSLGNKLTNAKDKVASWFKS